MASHDRREFDKYLKFLTFKVAQVVVQSRQGRKVKTKSAPHGNEWFNLTVVDDKQVSSELKHSLEGRLPQQDSPVCVDISMETLEGDSLVLEMWSVAINYSVRDISVSVSHLLYPRLSLMLKSLISISRTTPAYRLSRQHEENIKFTFRVYAKSQDDNFSHLQGFKSVEFAKTSCPYGTISLSLSYRPTIAFPDRAPEGEAKEVLTTGGDQEIVSDQLSQKKLIFPFVSDDSPLKFKDTNPSSQPFSAILPRPVDHSHLQSLVSTSRQDSGASHISETTDYSREDSDPSVPPGGAPAKESDGFILVNIGEIKPTFSEGGVQGMEDFLQLGSEVPDLDLFSSEQSTDVLSAMKIIEDKIE